MRRRFRRWWPILKPFLGLAIILLIGRQFLKDLSRPGLQQQPLQLPWLVVSGVLYLAGMGCSALYWRRLLAHLGSPAPLATSFQAYFLGQLGKYLPGKAWALALRAGLIHGAGVRLALAVLTTFYEVITTMAGGVILAGLLFAFLGTGASSPDAGFGRLWDVLWQQPQDATLGRGEALLLAAALLAVTALPLQPVIFNRLARRLLLPFHQAAAPIPHVRFVYFLEGLAWTSVGWLLLGASLAAALVATTGRMDFWEPAPLGRLTAALGLSYVAGFVVVVTPGGLGVREFFLTLFLTPLLSGPLSEDLGEARKTAVLVVLILRLTWTAAEALLAAPLYWLKRRPLAIPLPEPSAEAGAASTSPGGVP